MRASHEQKDDNVVGDIDRGYAGKVGKDRKALASYGSTKGQHCGTSFCGDLPVPSSPKVWGPIVAGTGIAIAAGITAGVVKYEGSNTSSSTGSSPDLDAGAAVAPSDIISQADRHAKMVAASSDSDPTLTLSPEMASVISEKMPLPPHFLAPAAATVAKHRVSVAPAEQAQHWDGWLLVVLAVIGCSCLCGTSLLIHLCRSSRPARKCTRQICPSLLAPRGLEGTESVAAGLRPNVLVRPYERYDVGSVRGAPAARIQSNITNSSDVEDAPLLPEGAGLPKFWGWLHNW